MCFDFSYTYGDADLLLFCAVETEMRSKHKEVRFLSGAPAEKVRDENCLRRPHALAVSANTKGWGGGGNTQEWRQQFVMLLSLCPTDR